MNVSDLPIIALRPFHPTEAAQIDIDTEFELYGTRPECLACGHGCKQYNAPSSVLVFCPRMREA